MALACILIISRLPLKVRNSMNIQMIRRYCSGQNLFLAWNTLYTIHPWPYHSTGGRNSISLAIQGLRQVT